MRDRQTDRQTDREIDPNPIFCLLMVPGSLPGVTEQGGQAATQAVYVYDIKQAYM